MQCSSHIPAIYSDVWMHEAQQADGTLKRDRLECCYTQQENTFATQLSCFCHVHFVVINEVRPLANGFLIQDTHKAQSSMNSLVSSEARAFTKGFLTLVALIWPFSSVNPSMVTEVGASPKGLPTFTALIWPFSSVNSLVFKERRALAKRFPTFAALIRL
uniref:Uncharacterized protein n=1 Tax=Felis catus TaxID=9685 RepID=A0ABI8AQJ3_FELCA